MCLAVLSAGVVRADPGMDGKPEVARPRTVLLLGDSLIVTSFGEYLEQLLNEHSGTRAMRRAKSSTGLARPDFFDWMTVGREEVERHQPDVVVVIMGGNDGQGLTDEKGKAKVQWGASGWEAAYRQRVADFLGTLGAPGRKLLWVELPYTGLPNFERKLGVIRRVLREAVSGHEASTYLETKSFFTDAKGSILREARVEGFRKPMKLKMEDGVHFTLAGGRYFATKVYPAVLGLLGPGGAEPRPASSEPAPVAASPAPSVAASPPPPKEARTREPAICREFDAVSEAPMTVMPMALCYP
ncbi:SGNH/GDSL hydrolase family protein [Archangium lansingense]|uniref:DUF459 domain-containing protein n=2 Tax=Archangium lansingense TaxID=2995310 RepID=A0ABT4ACB8_9BACT|nr:DUF459 domain-containing protein [Archangium lansinium]MCY1079319.1 DUF459 domain-containing protein [Archangium lansinium]